MHNDFMYIKNTLRMTVKNFIKIFPHRILIYGIMPVFGRTRRKSCRKTSKMVLSQGRNLVA